MNTFNVEGKIISGAIHYFRVVPEYWRDRLEKLKAMGCNTVETYVPWNLHERKKGEFCFEGILDLVRFIQLAEELGLWVIVRPSPYICAEWEFGGLPAWLLKDEGIHLRCNDERYMKHVREYYRHLLPLLKPLQITEGGPIILMQVENEYGYYGDDTSYLESLRDIMREEGITVDFVTSDGPWGDALSCGSVEGAQPTGNFGSKTKEQFARLREHTDGPLMCMEFWVGWFDSWGCGSHQHSDLEQNKKDLKEILELGHVNFYMFEGGTNFGFMNGSNYYDQLTPDVTSYDYDAILTEDGELTEKYLAFKDIIGQFVDIPEVELTTTINKMEYGELLVKEKVSLYSVIEDIGVKHQSKYPLSMEQVGQNYGYIMYRSSLVKENQVESIRLYGANDRANIFLNQKPIVTLYDRELLDEMKFESALDASGEAVMDILVENMGRVNFGPRLQQQHKGIKDAVVINGHQHYDWDMYSLELDNVEEVDFTKEYIEGLPAFYLFEFEVEELGDTFLDFTGWGKGCAFVNGFALGRYWEVGPQKRLYIPAPVLKLGKNEIILFETEGIVTESIRLDKEPDLG